VAGVYDYFTFFFGKHKKHWRIYTNILGLIPLRKKLSPGEVVYEEYLPCKK
jgi:hypothetical protein